MTGNDGRDYLTGIYNRKWLFEDCPVTDESGQFSVIYMDLDNFKAVNDLYGHEEGDRVLKYTAEAIKGSAEDGYPVRMSGDEFVLVLPGDRTRENLTEIYKNIVRKIAEGQKTEAGLALISLSAGAITRQGEGQSLQEVMNLGDNAMYMAKHAGKRRCVFYEDIKDKAEHDKRIEDEAPQAIKDDCFVLRLNPLLNMQNGMLEQTRVIAVWVRADGRELMPGEYRPILESNGYIRMLDTYLLEKLFRMLADMDISGFEAQNIRFSMEMSWLHFLDRKLENVLLEYSGKYNVPLSAIDISIAERALTARNIDRLIFGMKQLSEHGVSMSMKNFGSNFISIRYLNAVPVQAYMFDSKWLTASLEDEKNRRLVKSVIRLTKNAHKMVVAIGETEKLDRRFLADCGCDAIGDNAKQEFYEAGVYADIIEEKIPTNSSVIYDFNGNLKDRLGRYEGRFDGIGITFARGVTDNSGAVHFAGGDIGKNVIELPKEIFARNSYTIALWVYPEKEMNWSSAVYARFDGGFISFVPYTNADDGISVFRISVDSEGFFDTSCRAIKLNAWSHLCYAYDADSETVRSYINGRKGVVFSGNMPTMIGCRKVLLGGDPFQKSYVGSISSLCIYDYALSDSAAEELYQGYTKEPGFRGLKEDYWMDTE
ncbi:MAG: EAL domain-containing protein [Lachnospiraceae bacterium]|nr:EAL domain-containing protein [Lachnospiraceae bacterium]